MNVYKQFLLKTRNELVKIALELLDRPLPELTEELFSLFETTGNRIKYEAVYFERRKFLTVFGCLALWLKEEGGEAFTSLEESKIYEKLEYVLLQICQEDCWALPAHVNRAKNQNWRNTIDLFSSETAGTLAELTDKLESVLSADCAQRCKEQVLKRVLEPFFGVEPPFAHWERCEHNWNAVCVGNIGSAAIHLYKDEPDVLDRYISRICEDLACYAEGFADDGTCMEGLGYYTYGMVYFVNFANEIYEYSNGTIDLIKGVWGKFKAGEEDKRFQMATWWFKCYFASGRSVSFSDGSSNEKYRMGLGCALKNLFSQVQIPDWSFACSLEEDHCYRFLPMRMDIFETKKLAIATCADNTYKPDSFIVLQSARWCIGNSENGCFMALKGGHNDEPHNHNDVGSFLYGIEKELFFTDLGAGEYVREYFGPERYNILCNRSLGHNVPLLCGMEQKAGREYAAKNFKVWESDCHGECSMEVAGAYEPGKIDSFCRSFSFDKKKGDLTICDQFVAAQEGAIVTENFVTQYIPEIEDGMILLKGEENTCILTTEGIVPNIKISCETHSNHQGKTEAVYRIFFDIKIADRGKITIRISKLN